LALDIPALPCRVTDRTALRKWDLCLVALVFMYVRYLPPLIKKPKKELAYHAVYLYIWLDKLI